MSRRQAESDLAEEIRSHLDERTDELIRSGMSPRDAALEARRAFGNVTLLEQAARDVWRWPRLDSVAMDVRFALRQLRRSPVVAAAAIITLAIGIAANSTVFSWTRALLLNPIPGARDASRVVALESVTPAGTWTATSFLDYRDIRRYTHSFEALSVAVPLSLSVGAPAALERRWGELVSGNFFDLLRMEPAVGRFFTGAEQDDFAGDHPVVVLSHALWAARYRSDSSLIGRTILVDRQPLTVIGIAPAPFRGSMPGMDFEMWIPAPMLARFDPNGRGFLLDRKTRMWRVLARPKDGVSVAQARAELQAFVAVMSRANADVSAGMGATLLPLWQSHHGIQDHLRAPLLLLTGACGLLMLIVCANLANLLLARASARRRELGLRLALGAGRTRLVRQLLTETGILAAGGTVLGLAATAWLSGSLRLLVPSFAVPTLSHPQLDAGVVIFTIALACGVTILAGLAPALHGVRSPVADVLRSADRVAGSGGGNRLRSLLVMGETALAVIALVAAGLFIRSLQQTRQVEPGFDPHHVVMGEVSLATAGFDAHAGAAYSQALLERLSRIPGVTAVSYTDYVPLSLGSGSWEDLDIEGYTPAAGENMKIYRSAVAPGYFGLLKIPLVEGRDFTALDDSAATRVMVVNQEFVRRFLAGRSAIGARVHGWGRWFTVVGVARDIKTLRLTEPPSPYFWVPIRQVYRPEFPFAFMVRSSGPVADVAAALRRETHALDPSVPLFNVMTLDDYIAAPMAEQSGASGLLGLLAGISLLLAAVGLYGVMSYSVTQRNKEIGIRMALGASAAQVLRLVLGEATRLLALGLAGGLLVAVLLGHLVEAMLFGIRPSDPLVFAGAALFMAVVALMAAGLPARRAMRVDPMVALRFD